MTVKRMYRSRSNIMLGGVCSGIAKYLEVDPTLVRLTFVLLLFIGMGGLWIYLILWVIMPEESKEDTILHVDAKTIEVDRLLELKNREIVEQTRIQPAIKQGIPQPVQKKATDTPPKPKTGAK